MEGGGGCMCVYVGARARVRLLICLSAHARVSEWEHQEMSWRGQGAKPFSAEDIFIPLYIYFFYILHVFPPIYVSHDLFCPLPSLFYFSHTCSLFMFVFIEAI